MNARPLVMCVLLVATTGCEWFTDFKRQPHVVTWESWRTDSLGVRGAPQGSVPTDGTAMPSWLVSYSPSIATIDSLAAIPNPVPVTEASLANGRKHFQINCAVCHGANADGQTPNSRYGLILSLPAGKAYSVKFNWSRGATARLGSNFTTYGIALQRSWLD